MLSLSFFFFYLAKRYCWYRSSETIRFPCGNARVEYASADRDQKQRVRTEGRCFSRCYCRVLVQNLGWKHVETRALCLQVRRRYRIMNRDIYWTEGLHILGIVGKHLDPNLRENQQLELRRFDECLWISNFSSV